MTKTEQLFKRLELHNLKSLADRAGVNYNRIRNARYSYIKSLTPYEINRLITTAKNVLDHK